MLSLMASTAAHIISACLIWTRPEIQRRARSSNCAGSRMPPGRPQLAIAVRSNLAIDTQVGAQGATSLDRQLVAKEPIALSEGGFGAEVREAMSARVDHHVEAKLAHRQGQRVVFARDLLENLRRRELEAAAARIESETGLPYQTVSGGEHVAGIYRQRVTLSSGRFAMIDNGLGFSLVPWSPSLEHQLGKQVSGIAMPGGSIDWSFGRKRGLQGFKASPTSGLAAPYLRANVRGSSLGAFLGLRRPYRFPSGQVTGKFLRRHVRNQDPLGPDPRRLRHRARDHVGGNAMDCLAARLSAPTRRSLVCGWETAALSAGGFLLVVVFFRRLRAADLIRGCDHHCLGRFRCDHRCDRHVSLAGAGSEKYRDLWLRALGDRDGDPRRWPSLD